MVYSPFHLLLNFTWFALPAGWPANSRTVDPPFGLHIGIMWYLEIFEVLSTFRGVRRCSCWKGFSFGVRYLALEIQV
jgi:hypothetical protein